MDRMRGHVKGKSVVRKLLRGRPFAVTCPKPTSDCHKGVVDDGLGNVGVWKHFKESGREGGRKLKHASPGTRQDSEKTAINRILARDQASHPCSRELNVQYSFC